MYRVYWCHLLGFRLATRITNITQSPLRHYEIRLTLNQYTRDGSEETEEQGSIPDTTITNELRDRLSTPVPMIRRPERELTFPFSPGPYLHLLWRGKILPFTIIKNFNVRKGVIRRIKTQILREEDKQGDHEVDSFFVPSLHISMTSPCYPIRIKN